MEVEEPSEKLDVFVTRGPKENETTNEVKKPDVIENDEEASGEEDKENKEKGEGTSTRVVYSRDDLTDVRDSPAAKLWPAFADDDCVRNGVWDPELWHHTPSSAKRCASPVDDIKRQLIIEDGIVLSPQRQSFGQGCHVPQSAPEKGTQQERTKGMISRTIERDTRDGRSRLTGRVGRGSRSTDYRTSSGLRDRNRNGDVRQNSLWDRNDKDSSYSYKRGRKRRDDDDKDPEWMTFGPTSQLETIELRGFNKEEFLGKRGKASSFTGSSDGVPSPVTVKEKHSKDDKPPKQKTTNVEEKDKEKKDGTNDDADFDINQFFMSDSFLQFSDGPDQSNSNESRFCQFFGIRGHGSQGGSRRSSAAEELLEYSGVSSGSPSTPHTPSPNQNFMFTPIKPVQANTEPETISEMLQKTKLDVKPLLESVLMSGKRDEMRIKGLQRLEDIETTADKTIEEQVQVKPKPHKENGKQDMVAFFKLVENMKSSGNLPEKPQPVIPGLPSHLLPRPPSPKSKSSHRSPSPIQKINRTASPVDFLQLMMQNRQSPSPPQVVPQMNRPYSPMESPLYKSVEMLQRSSSPLNSMFDQKTFSPLLTPEAFMSPSPVHPSQVQHRPSPAHPPQVQHRPSPAHPPQVQHRPSPAHLPQVQHRPSPAHPPQVQHRPSPAHPSHFQHRPDPMMYQVPDKPRFELPNEGPAYHTNKQMPKPNNVINPKVTPKTQSSVLRDLGFMPTSVLQKIKKDQMTPKPKANGDNTKPTSTDTPLKVSTDKQVNATLPVTVAAKEMLSPEHKKLINNLKEEKTLLKPTAFKPYQGSSPHSVSPLRSGVHSEPQSPATHSVTPTSPHHQGHLPSSAPVTPQRHPQAQHHLLMNLEGRVMQVNNEQKNTERVLQDKYGPVHNMASVMNHSGKGIDDNRHIRNDVMSHPKHDHDPHHPMSIPQNVHQQQQLRREEMHNFANMGRTRPSPLHMMGGQVSPQSVLGSPTGMPRVPYPVPNMHQGKPPMHPSMMRPLHPNYFRMMPSTRTPSIQSQASLMQMMPQQHHMPQHAMIPRHTPMTGHHGYGPINPQMMHPPSPAANFPIQRQHPGYMHHQGKVVNTSSPESRQSPSNDNALSKWFTDDVLRGMQSTTKIPTQVGSKKVMSVEDLERQQSLRAPLTL